MSTRPPKPDDFPWTGDAARWEWLVARHAGGHGERVEKPEELAGALARARDAVVRERKQALVNVICPD